MWSNIPAASSPAGEQTHQEQDDNHSNHNNFSNQINRSNNLNESCKRRYGSPLVRHKHAVCAAQTGGHIYIHGGRFGNLALDDDVWRFDPHHNTWIQLQTTGCRPPSLQEHSLLEHNRRLYLFGGQISAPSQESCLWCLDLDSNEWRQVGTRASSRYGAHLGPSNRRGHTAVLHNHSMYVYGGFEDFRGSSGQLWEFDLLQERWELRNLSAASACHPEPRHSHSAVVHQNDMYVYGGLSNLKPLGDLWRWSWPHRRWFRERTRGSSPGPLHGHSAVQAFGSMFVFGGERNGRPTRALWRLNLANLTWQKVRAKGPRPSPTTWHGAVANPLGMLDAANYLIEGDPEQVLACCRPETDAEGETEMAMEPQPCAVLAHSQSSNGAQLDRSKRRASRLGFLRKVARRPAEMRTSLSASTFNRPPSIKTEASQQEFKVAAVAAPTDAIESQARNVGILDSLDSDIKRMFQQALSPPPATARADDCDESGPPMSVEHPATSTSRSHYLTAQAENSRTCGLSQRTSCAYATPPSELDTLTGECGRRQLPASGYDRRDNRPRSEIVQSLIERADARIKYLYTPYFNANSNSNADAIALTAGNEAAANRQPPDGLFAGRRTSKQRRGHSFLDKSKRHTIHQTMTYYNLYYSEESKSSSGDSATHRPERPSSPPAAGRRQPDDFGSSSTMKAAAELRSSSPLQQQVDQVSLLEDGSVRTSSETRTVCQESEGAPLASSLQNALTALRDTSPGSGDNTSLSFSAIGEFEEDDMLQFSSPVSRQQDGARRRSEDSLRAPTWPEAATETVRAAVTTARTETVLMSDPEDHLQTMILSDQSAGRPHALVQVQAQMQAQPQLHPVNKSSSSGYDSLASRAHDDTPSRRERLVSESQAGASSLRTSGSGSSSPLSSSMDTGASSERSASKKLRPASPSSPGGPSSQSRPSDRSPVGPSKPPPDARPTAKQARTTLVKRPGLFGRGAAKSRYWQLCMFVIGGKEGPGSQTVSAPITVWRLYI